MTEGSPERLIRDTLADWRTLMSHPVALRRGYTALVKPANPPAGGGFTYKVDDAYYERIVAVTFQLAASAAVGNRQAVLNYQDADGFTFTQVPALGLVQASQALSAFGDLNGITPVTSTESANAYGTQNAPAASTTIVQIPGLPIGSYQVSWSVEVSGTLAAGVDNDNFKLTLGGTQIFRSVNLAVAGVYPQESVEIEQLAAGAVAVQNIAAATVGSVYAAQLNINPLNQAGAQLELPDVILKPNWQLAIVVANIQAGDQVGQIGILTERYASNWAGGQLEHDLEELLEQ